MWNLTHNLFFVAKRTIFFYFVLNFRLISEFKVLKHFLYDHSMMLMIKNIAAVT